MVIENGSKCARSVSADDWYLLLQTIRSLMICDETMRLYPDGHQRVRETIKGALSRVQEYHAATRRVFTFAPELALDVSDLEGSRGAKDVITLANRLREHLIQRLAIHPEVDCDSLEALLRRLQSSPLAFDSDEVPEWPHIELERYRDGADGDDYRFNSDGDQLVRASESSSGHAAANLPPSLRKSLDRAFAESGVRESIARLQSSLGLSESDPDGGVDLVEQIVESLFSSGTLSDASHDVLVGKLHDFLRFLEGLAPALPASGEAAAQLTRKDVRDLVARAIGMQYQDQAGVAEIFEHSARLKALLSGTDSFRMRGDDAGTAYRSLHAARDKENRLKFTNNDVGPAASSSASEPDPAEAASTAPEAGPGREKPSGEEDVWEEEPQVSPNFSARRAVEMYGRQVVEHLESFDYDLEALRIRRELLAAESTAEGYTRKRAAFLEEFGSRKWSDFDSFSEELESTMETLAARESDQGVGLAGEVLSAQSSQEVVDRFFRRRVDAGASVASLRPLIRALAARDVVRPAGALSSLWRKADRRKRDRLIDEVYGLLGGASEPDKLAEWGRSHTAAFASPRSLAHLKSLTTRSLEKVLREIMAPGGDAARGNAQAAGAVLEAIGGEPEHERLVLLALRKGSRAVRKRALDVLGTCTTRDLLDELTKIIERENEKPKIDVDQVHLALNAMVKSPLPQARERLRRFRTERHLLRHVYRSDIRKILDLLCKMDGATL